MSALIEGRVAEILSDNYIVINVGSSSGVKVGMIFVVLAQGEEVKDPATGEVLGRWEVPKGYVRATHVQERLTTCEAYDPHRRTTEDESAQVLSAAMIAHSMRPDTWGGNKPRLNVNRSQVSGMPAIGPISVGDVVRQVELPSLEGPHPKSESEK